MSKYSIERSTLEDIADAIREKRHITATLSPAQMVIEIGNISGDSWPDGDELGYGSGASAVVGIGMVGSMIIE